MQRSIETQFTNSLLDLVDLYEQRNNASNGDLALLLNDLVNATQEESELLLSNSGLVNMELLNSLILDASTKEAQLEIIMGEEYVSSVIAGIIGDIDDPPSEIRFWCVECQGNGVISSPPDRSACYEEQECRKVRFWKPAEYNLVAGLYEQVGCP